MIPTRKKGNREEISNWNSKHYFKISTKGTVGLNRNRTCKLSTK
jgi:hypothetical protein